MRNLLQWSWWTGSVSRRIGVITLLTMILTAAVAAVSLRGLHALNSELDRTVREQSQAASLVGAMLQEAQRLSDSARLAASAATPEERDAALLQLEASKKALGERVDEISARLSNAPELQKALQDGFSSFVISAVKASRLIKAGRTPEAERELLTAFDPKLLSYVLMTVSGISDHTEHAVEAVAVTGHGAYNATLGLLLPILVAVAAGMITSHVLLRSTVIKPVQRVARAAEQLAQGTFDIDLTSTSRDECGDMLHAMASLRGQLASMIEAISSASSAVATTADSLAEDNHDLSSRTNEQARAFREASQALEALNVMAQKSAEGARQVSNDMQQAFSSAQRGNDVIVQAVATMQTSAEASRRIADTVGMIDEIAFKTNILALNAAVEAARAGEHGRSFAVVAAEVRELAGKSATAAKEIAALIDSSVVAVTRGSQLVGEAGAAMETIVRQVRDAADRMSDISAASREQSMRAGQVTSAMSEIDSGTQRNAGMVSQAAASTETLRSEARTLMASVSEFTHRQEAEAA
ncbi:MAG TPA: methyl-accepting chemotaxis protein [Steroidobacteraceae bacterium]|nr:methyl-accepting chemotaxis protein [Steroidobacteraceae bacterium]